MTIKELFKNPYFDKEFTEVEIQDKSENGSNCIITRDYTRSCIVRAKEIVKKHKLGYDPGNVTSSRLFWEQFTNAPIIAFYSKFPKIKMDEFEELSVCKHFVSSLDTTPHNMEFLHRMEWIIDIEDPKFRKAI